MMRFISVCSGIEAASVAWNPLGWKAIAFAEIEKFPCAVLAHHYPRVPNWGDIVRFKEWPDADVDLLAGGTPCQSFSVAGLRKGLDDPRGNLMLTYLAIARRYRPRWLVWENVPGVLSSNEGRDFGTFLGGLGECGYGFAYRVLDAQHFGVPQRRRRVFVVGHLGDWRRAAAVLFERHSLQGHPAPRREAGEGTTHDVAPCIGASGRGFERTGDTRGQDCVIAAPVAPTIGARTTAGGGLGTDFDCDGGLIANCLGTKWHGEPESQRDNDVVTHTLKGEGFDAGEDGTGRGTPLVVGTLTGNGDAHSGFKDEFGLVALPVTSRVDRGGAHREAHGNNLIPIAYNITPSNSNRDYNARASDRAQAITGAGNRPSARGGDLIAATAVRRLTPRECERLQGFPDDYTLILYRGKPAADGPRYKALGNSMAVPVVRWIGERVSQVEGLSQLVHGRSAA